MTNHWTDIGNSSLVFVIGANPAENHPACMAHINSARYDIHYDDAGNPVSFGRNARMIVVDPRRTRTAQQTEGRAGDLYVRIRPGTDIAFINGLLNYIFTDFESATPYNATAAANFMAFHNGTTANSTSGARTFVDDGGTTRTLSAAELAAVPGFGSGRGWPKYTDARVRINDAPSATDEAVVLTGTTASALKHIAVKNAPAIVVRDAAGGGGTLFTEGAGADYTVNYLSGTIVRTAGSTIPTGSTVYVSYSYKADDYERTTMTTASGWTFSNMLAMADTVNPSSGNPTVYQKLKAHVAAYDLATAADICGCQQSDIVNIAKALIDNSRFADANYVASLAANGINPTVSTYRATTLLYAMGATQHTNGSQNIRDYAVLQTMMGNMGRPGGGINALRGIHNVQGSTDMGVLYDSIPAYSGNPGTSQSYADYSNKLFGNRVLAGSSPVTVTARSPYTPSDLGLQQRGFYNMTREWFGDTTVSASADFDKLWDLWPKGNGYDHITAFRNMASGSIKAAVVWGQNPAVTEPNQSAVREGLKQLDVLVCVDMFANETAECERKTIAGGATTDGITYLIPACSHVEEAGSVTNSGRWLQWRDRATTPRGNSKADLELLFKFAKALNTANAFSHIKAQWATMNSVATLYNGGAGADPFTVLYAKYGYDGVDPIDKATDVNDPNTYTYKGADTDGNTLGGTEYVADRVFWEMARPLDLNNGTTNNGGTIWIYSGNGNAAGYTTTAGKIDTQPTLGSNPWTVSNRAKSRNNTFSGLARNFPRWGFAWLLNRRVMYNNGELANDVSDNYVAPGLMARMFTINSNTLADWSLVYRAYNTVNDVPSTELAASTPHVAGGRFPAHTEPYESPRNGSDGKADLITKYGYNTSKGNALIKSDGMSPRGTVADYPLVLTTIRCVEHFQGGPITRNNSWNVEAEPVPWIEINSVDARKAGIFDGDMVNVITARSNSTTDQEAHTPGNTGWAKGFKARVGSGIQSQQRVAAGVVAIPWHWGDRGLSKGSRANDLTIDAWDANTIIPEYKACLCKIVKL